MKKQDWTSETFSLAWLRERRFDFDPLSESPVFEWLKSIGAVPASVHATGHALIEDGHASRYSQNQPVLNLDGDAIPARYLALTAGEWDTWGKSTPTQFLDAIELETAGHTKRDTVYETLWALGRAIAEEESEDKTYRLRLPNGYAA